MRNPCRTTLRGAILHVLSVAISLGCASGALAQASPPEPSGLGTSGEYILGFIQYVRWPAEESIRTWQVCVPSAPASKAASYSGRTARGRPLTVRQVAASDALAECQILDLTDAPAASAKPLLAQARKQPVLTIGEGSHFCSAGGVICLRARHGAGGFEINLSAVQEAGLNVNAQLLMLGRRRQTASGGK
jgi:hypothetical protein